MAITKICAVKSHLHQLLRYVGDKNKTVIDTGVANLIGYETDEYKTEERLYPIKKKSYPNMPRNIDFCIRSFSLMTVYPAQPLTVPTSFAWRK